MIRAGKSKIDGWGVFATQRINPGTIAERSRTIPVDVPDYVYDGGNDMPELALGLASLLNHSENANCKVAVDDGWAEIIVIRRIARGEELTIDYGEEWWSGRDGSPNGQH